MPTSKSSTSSEPDYKAMLLDLLAVVHRDGGHYTTLAGLTESFEDAKAKVAWAYHDIAELKRRVR